MKMLKLKLYQLEVDERDKKKAAVDAAKKDVSFGSQIRSYVFQPYTMVNDHRTELKMTDVQKIMDGAHRPVHRSVPEAVRREPGGGVSADDLNFVMKARREKLDALLARGVAPYGYRFERSHGAAAAAAEGAALAEGAEGARVKVAGRLVAWRGHGKTIFAHLGDPSGRIQLYFKKDALGEELWALVEALDIGDIVGIEGPLFRTRTGESTVRVTAVTLLAKSLRPLPMGKEETVDGQVVRHAALRRRRAALPAALRRSRGASRGARALRGAHAHDQRHPRLPRRPRLPRSGDAGAAAAVRRRRGASLRHAAQRARHARSSCASRTSCTSSA